MGGRGGSSHQRAGGGGLSSVQNDVRSIENWIRQQNWFAPGSGVRLSGIDPNAARGVAEAYQRIFQRYPQLIGLFDGVSSAHLGPGTYADCNLATGRIRVGIELYSDAAVLRTSYSHDIRSNWHPVGTDWSAIVTHELGHAIDGYISQKMRSSDHQYYDFYHNSKVLQEKIGQKLGISVTKADIEREVSRYGATSTAEWFAEAFAEAIHSDHPRPMAAEFMKELELILRRIR